MYFLFFCLLGTRGPLDFAHPTVTPLHTDWSSMTSRKSSHVISIFHRSYDGVTPGLIWSSMLSLSIFLGTLSVHFQIHFVYMSPPLQSGPPQYCFQVPVRNEHLISYFASRLFLVSDVAVCDQCDVKSLQPSDDSRQTSVISIVLFRSLQIQIRIDHVSFVQFYLHSSAAITGESIIRPQN